MPVRTWGCLNRRCRHEFDSTEEPATRFHEDKPHVVPCEVCHGPTKWIPGLTQVIRPLAESSHNKPTKSRLAHANDIVERAREDYNQRVDNPGLKLGDIRAERGETAIKLREPSQESTRPFTFYDAGGNPWNTRLAVDSSGRPQDRNSWPRHADVTQKLTEKGMVGKPWNAGLAPGGKDRPPTRVVARDRGQR